MIVTLEFDLPEQKDEHEMYINAPKYYCALDDIFQWLYKGMKYENKDKTLTYEEVFDRFMMIVKENDLDMP